MPRYTIGVDFGSLSGRAVLVDTADGREIASAQYEYPHAIMDCLNGRRLPDGWALQHPRDYLTVLEHTLPVLAAKVNPDEIAGIGLDCTASTVLPVDAEGVPLCFQPEYGNNPYAYVMMWKHHGGQAQANRMTELARKRGEKWLDAYGGIVNAEWYFPKLLQILEEAPKVYHSMAHYVEAADWLVWQLTGCHTRSYGCLGYKAFLHDGAFPDKYYFGGLNPKFADVIEEKVSGRIVPLGACAGRLTQEAAACYGLKAGIPVAAGNIDAHACVPAAGIDGMGKLLAIIGTSTCHIVMGKEMFPVPGMSGVVMDGVLPGLAAYEAGQSSVGDQFHWFEINCISGAIRAEAAARGMSVQEWLTEKAAPMKPGQSGLVAMDWWNGNRSVLADTNLSGLILGMTLSTAPHEIYRALLESTAYGARMILDSYRQSGVQVDAFYASGGISQKNSLTMQIYADVLQLPVHVVDAAQGPALGSAIYAAAAAGIWPDVAEGARRMGAKVSRTYEPIAENATVYEQLYQEYRQLHDYFGRGQNSVMKRLKNIRKGGYTDE